MKKILLSVVIFGLTASSVYAGLENEIFNTSYNKNIVGYSQAYNNIDDEGRISFDTVKEKLESDDFDDDLIMNLKEKYSDDERVCYRILQNYYKMKNLEILDNAIIAQILKEIDWKNYDGNNYALNFAQRLQNSGHYSNSEINHYLNSLDWSKIKNPPSAQVASIINKGYLKYFDLYYSSQNVPLINEKNLSNLEKCIDLMKNVNVDDNGIKKVIKFSQWDRADETYLILQELIKLNMNIADNWYFGDDMYSMYITAQRSNKVDKTIAFSEELKKYQKSRQREQLVDSAMDGVKNVGKALTVPAVFITAPIWVPALFIGIHVDCSRGDSHCFH